LEQGNTPRLRDTIIVRDDHQTSKPGWLGSARYTIYHLEHNFGHGKQNLAMMFAALNLLAFAFHTVCDCLEDPWIKARQAKRARKRFFEHIRTVTAYLVFPDWRTFMQTLIDSKPPPEIEAQITR
jgi:hypothetical protein